MSAFEVYSRPHCVIYNRSHGTVGQQQLVRERHKPAVTMAESGKTNETYEAAAHQANADQQSVVSRVSNFPLVSSACGVVSSAYSSTKDNVPLLKGVMDVAESGVRTLTAAATTGSKPLLDMLEPQIATINDYAMMGLDKMEEKLPILHQPADKLVSDTVGMVYQSVAGARDAMTGAVMGAVKGGVDLTRAAVSGGINTVLGTSMGQMVSSGMGLALSRSEDWVEQNLPISEKELAALAEPSVSEVIVTQSTPSYFVRLGKLSAKVRDRALELSLQRALHARDATYSSISKITNTLDQLESARTTLGTAGNQIGEAPEKLLQHLKEWKKMQSGDGQMKVELDGTTDKREHLEWQALSMVRSFSDQLQSACSRVVTSAQGLPSVVQDQLASTRRSAEELHSSLGNTSNLTPLLLEQSRHHLTQVQQSLDGVMEYLLHNTPLNWLVGPFAPQITEKGGEQPMEPAHPKK